MRIGFTSPCWRRFSDQRPLVRGREVDLLRPGAVAEALHLENPALAVEAPLPDDHPDEDERKRDAEEYRPEVDQRPDDGADDQEAQYGDGDLHQRRGL